MNTDILTIIADVAIVAVFGGLVGIAKMLYGLRVELSTHTVATELSLQFLQQRVVHLESEVETLKANQLDHFKDHK